jgi:hypothetical protein
MSKGTTSNVTRKTARQVVAGKTAAGAAMDVSPRTAQTLTEEDVARRAYEIYLAEGSPEGRHLEHWRRAEAELRAGRNVAS